MLTKKVVRAIKGQKTWIDYGKEDLRKLNDKSLLCEAEIIEGCESLELALDVLKEKLLTSGKDVGVLTSPMGKVYIHESTLHHIVEKRKDARERYIDFAIQTICNPFEIYDVEYDDHSIRRIFIGAFEGKRQMLVIAKEIEDENKWFWNFMHCDAKKLNKHRNGKLIYCRT